jgi:2-oxoglutarate ferredoxin oxidoreductase subunit alpha
MVLFDGYLANGSEPWKLPNVDDLKPIGNHVATENNNPDGGFLPYVRDEKTLARQWAIPGTPGLEHRVGGLEKQALTGNVSYDPQNHEEMCKVRAEKVARIANFIPDQEVFGSEDGLLVLAWGSTYGAIRQAVIRANQEGKKVAHAHIRHLSPFPKNLESLCRGYEKILIPEMNLGQLSKRIRAEFFIDSTELHKVQGQPFKVSEITSAIDNLL